MAFSLITIRTTAAAMAAGKKLSRFAAPVVDTVTHIKSMVHRNRVAPDPVSIVPTINEPIPAAAPLVLNAYRILARIDAEAAARHA